MILYYLSCGIIILKILYASMHILMMESPLSSYICPLSVIIIYNG